MSKSSIENEDHSPSEKEKENLLQHGMEVNHRYKIDYLIGRGGYGEVYKGIDQTLGREVAIKVLYKQHDGDQDRQRREEQRFVNEARITAQLIHSSLPITHDFGSLNIGNGEFFIVCEFLDGRALSDIVDETPLSVSESLEFIVQSAGALAVAHGRGILHRDLKPSNIFCINDDSQVNNTLFKVLDFGIAKVAQDNELAGLNSDETREGLIVGTPRYMAPERLQGNEYGTPSDIYGLGVIFYKMLTQNLPFKGDNLVSILLNQMKGPPPQFKLEGCSSALRQSIQSFFEAMTHVDPRLRIQTAVEVKKRAAKIQVDFSEELANAEPLMPLSNTPPAQVEGTGEKSQSSQESLSIETPYQDDFNSPFGSGYDDLFDDGFGGDEEYTSASRISKNQLKSLNQEDIPATSAPQQASLKSLDRLKSPSTPTPSEIQKVQLSPAQTKELEKESQRLDIQPSEESVDLSIPSLPVSSELSVDLSIPSLPANIELSGEKSVSRQPVVQKAPTSQPPTSKQNNTVKFIVLGLLVVGGFGLFLVNFQSTRPSKTEDKISYSQLVASKQSEEVNTINTFSSDEVDLEIEQAIEIESDTEAISQTKKSMAQNEVEQTKLKVKGSIQSPSSSKAPIKNKKINKKSKKKPKASNSEVVLKSKPKITLPKKVTLFLSPRKPTYLVGNRLKLIIKADGKKSTAAKISFTPKGAAKLKGNTLVLKKEGSLSVRACIASVCGKRKVIVYNDLFSDFE